MGIKIGQQMAEKDFMDKIQDSVPVCIVEIAIIITNFRWQTFYTTVLCSVTNFCLDRARDSPCGSNYSGLIRATFFEAFLEV